MKRVDGVVGNVDCDPALADAVAEHEDGGTLENVVLDNTERRRSRLRVTTDSGTDLGVLVDQPELTAGDVLVLDDDRAVVVAFEEREAFIIEFPAAESAVSTAVELGHRIGNQHWDLAIEGDTVYVTVEADRAIIEDVLGPYLPADAATHYETVDAERFIDSDDNDTKTAGHSSDHDHVHGDHDHTHGGDDHDHSHSGDVHNHSHEPRSTSMSAEER